MATKEDARQIVKEGKVTVCYPERHSARVEFEDKDGLISAELPILTPCAAQNKFYSLPDVGETVVCLMATNTDDGTGWIIGSRYHDKATPKANSQDVSRIDFKDGTFIEYNRESHEMAINCTGNLQIECRGTIRLKGQKIYLNE